MRLMLIGDWDGSTIEEIGERFDGGDDSNPPEPCKLITRWHDPSSQTFWLVVDAPDTRVLQEWMSRWTDIVDWETYPVLDDAEVTELIENFV